MMLFKHNQTVITILFFIGIAIFFTYPIAGDGDFFHHFNTGRHIIENGEIPRTDIWTFTATGRPWIAYAWGMGVIYYALYSVFGYLGINFFGALIAVLTFFLLFKLLQSYGISIFSNLVILSFAAPVLSSRWPSRPELVTYPMVAAYLLLDQHKEKQPRLIWLYPLLTLLWANLYGSSVFIGLALLLFFVFKKKPTPTFTLAVLLSYGLSLVNPFGIRTLIYISLIPQVAKIQGEWAGIIETLNRAPLIYTLVFQYRVLLYVLYVVGLCVCFFFNLKSLFKRPLLTFFATSLVIPFYIFRHAALAVILSLPLLGVTFSQTTGKTKLLVSIILCFLASLSITISLWTHPRGLGIDIDTFPPQLIEFVAENEIWGNAYNSQVLGGWLTYHFYPKILVYTDTRDDLFIGSTVMTDFFTTLDKQESILPLITKYSTQLVIADLAEGPSYQPLFYSDNWVPVWVGGHYAIFIPKDLAVSKNIPILDAIDPFHPNTAKPNHERDAVTQYQLALRQEPDAVNTQLRLATVLITLKRFDEAILVARNIHVGRGPHGPMFAAVRDYLLARAYFSKDDCSNTRVFLDQVQREISHQLIFVPDRQLPSPINKGYAFYYLLCEKNIEKARFYLNSYLSEIDVDPGEKRATSEQFNNRATLKL